MNRDNYDDDDIVYDYLGESWDEEVEDPQTLPKSPGKVQEKKADTGKRSGSALNDLLLLLLKIGLVCAFLVFLTVFLFGVTQQRDTSMNPAVKEGDIAVFYRPSKDYAVNDPVVVEYNGKLQVRRVVAMAGDVVDINPDGGLVINGSTQIEDGIYTQTLPYKEGITFPVTVGDGEVFVLGDNRTSAEDSRMYGTVRIGATKGKVIMIIRRRGI